MIFKKVFVILFLLIFSFVCIISEETQKLKKKKNSNKIKQFDLEKEKKLQFGFGVVTGSADFSTLGQMKKDMMNGETQQGDKKALVTNMNFGLSMRLLVHCFIMETMFNVIPYNTQRDKTELIFTPMVGVRVPFFIMPYLMTGMSFDFAFNIHNIKEDRSDMGKMKAIRSNLYFTPGFVIKTGVEIKKKKVSFGLFYQYNIYDFNEFSHWVTETWYGNLNKKDTIQRLLGDHSQIGIMVSLYVPRKRERKKFENNLMVY